MEDTIVAIATPPGSGGVGVIRISGVQAKPTIKKLFYPASETFVDFRPWTLHRGHIVSSSGAILDDVLAVYMPSPKTFTGEDIIEIHCHGGYFILNTIIEEIIAQGIRIAERGEFSKRAFLNGRIDLTQAEAIAELISAPSQEEARFASSRLSGALGEKIASIHEQIENLRAWISLAVDFPEEESGSFCIEKFILDTKKVRDDIYDLVTKSKRSCYWRSGVTVALAGAVNAGKSSILNAVLGCNRAIVTQYPGTTRDFLEESITIEGLPIRFVDTAGIRESSDCIEMEGIHRGKEKINTADIVLLVIDGSKGVMDEDKKLLQEIGNERTLLVWNKVDIQKPEERWFVDLGGRSACSVCVSAKERIGIEVLLHKVRHHAIIQGGSEFFNGGVAPNIRQASLLSEGLEELEEFLEDIQHNIPYELCAVRLESITSRLASIIGANTSNDVLNRIFSSFCIGK